VTTLEIQVGAPRVSDAERDQAIDLLQLGAAEGRLSHETFLGRIEAVLAARRQSELRRLVADLAGGSAARPEAEPGYAHPKADFGTGQAPYAPTEGRLSRWLVAKVSAVSAFRQRIRSAWLIPQLPRLMLPEPTLHPLRIGRGSDCDLPLVDESISRRHAELIYQDGAWILRDLHSTNGTTVNGWRITTAAAIRPGDVVGFGDLVFCLGAR
jgi:FHA domain/Domain of unknown function (DUF1707)